MKIYQVIYNSAPSTLTGGTGFGVTRVSEGTPKEYMETVKNSSALRTYKAGKFSISSDELFKSPERIFEYPVGYYYKVVLVKDKPVYVLGRLVNACFDHSFYVTGKYTRPGNYVAHILMSEQPFDKKVFSLLSDEIKNENIHFIPKDWTPSQANAEMVELMTGKPNDAMSVLNDEYLDFPLTLDTKALDLLFSYRLALKENKAIMVSLKDAITANIMANFMNLLPESLVKDATFVINHQDVSYATDAKISVVNEYFTGNIYPNLCTHIDLINDNRAKDKVEEIWRPLMEQAIKENDSVKYNKLVNWVFSPMSDDCLELSSDLNEALFNYSQDASLFTLATVDADNEILKVLSKYVKSGAITANHLNTLIIKKLEEASNLADYDNVIYYCEKAKAVGLDISESKNRVIKLFTDYIIADSELIYDALVLFKENILAEYTAKDRYPKFSKLISDLLSKDIQQLICFAKYLEKDARVRVENYINLLNKSPENLSQYTKLLDSDKLEAEKFDYIGVLKEHLTKAEFSNLYYQQIKRDSSFSASTDLLKRIYDLSEKNAELKNTILKDDFLFSSLYNSIRRQTKGNFLRVQTSIDNYVLTLLLPENKSKKNWQLLSDVLNLNVTEKTDILSYYDLAKEIENIEALKTVAPYCFKEFSKEQINEFLAILKQYNIMSDVEIIDIVLSKNSKYHLSYVIPLARMYDYDYDKIYELVSKCRRDATEKEIKKIIKSEFKKLYNKHAREVFFAKLKSLFKKKKDKDNKEE